MQNEHATYSGAFAEPVGQRVLQVALLLVVALVVFLAGSGRMALTDEEESRYALIAKNMVDGEDYLRPQKVINGDPYFDKPPLYFWLTAVSFEVLGPSNFSSRVVPAVGACLMLAATYLVAASLFNHVLGLVSAGTLLATVVMIGFGKYVRMDVYLAAFVGFALWAFIQGFHSPENRKWFALMYVPIALGMLTKGPVAVVIPGAVILVFLLLQRRMGTLWRMKVILGVAMLIVLAGPWFLYMTLEYPATGDQPGYFGTFFLKHNVGRFWSSSLFGHGETMLMYPFVVAVSLLPWTGATMLACARYLGPGFRRENNDWRSQFLLVWAGLVVVFFALAETKLPNYILPAFVPLGVLTGRYVYDYWQSDLPRRRHQRTFLWAYPVAWGMCGTVVVMVGAAALAAIYVRFYVGWSNVPAAGFWERFAWLICFLYRLAAAVILAKVFLAMLRERHLERLAWVVGVAVLALAIDLSYTELPRIANACSTRQLVPTVVARAGPEDPILAGPEERRSLQLYLGRRWSVRQLKHLTGFGSEYMDFPGRMVYLATSNIAFNQIPLSMRDRVEILHQVREERLLLIRPKPPDPPAPEQSPRPAGATP